MQARDVVIAGHRVAMARELVIALPYALTLAALAVAGGRRPDDPAALGTAYRRS